MSDGPAAASYLDGRGTIKRLLNHLMPDRLDRSFDRNAIALTLAGPMALVAFIGTAVIVPPPTADGAWSITVSDLLAGLVFNAWFLLPLPLVLVFGLEGVLRMRRLSLLSLSAAAVCALGALTGPLTLFAISWMLFPGDPARITLFGGVMGLASALTIVMLRDARAASLPRSVIADRTTVGQPDERPMGYECKCCGVWHDERPTAFGADMPLAVAQLADDERAARVALSSDQCILDDQHFFILGNLDVPVKDFPEVLSWSVWATLSEASFERCSELWHSEGRESEPPYFGWLSNQLPGYPRSVNIGVLVHTQPLGVRPRLEVIEESHPLRTDQREGITAARADELIHSALYGDVA